MAAGRWSHAPISLRRLARSTPCWRRQLAGSTGERLFHLIRNELKGTTPNHPGVSLVLMIAIRNLAGLVIAAASPSGTRRTRKGHFASPGADFIGKPFSRCLAFKLSLFSVLAESPARRVSTTAHIHPNPGPISFRKTKAVKYEGGD